MIDFADDPLVLVKGEMQHIWDSEGNKYIDLVGQNICISVGHGHPKVQLDLNDDIYIRNKYLTDGILLHAD